MSRRFLITGGAGFIGSAVVRDIIDNTDGCVLVVDKLTYAASLDTLARVSHDPRYAFLRADICDAARMQETFASFRPDTVMHLAAESHVDRSIEGPGIHPDERRRHFRAVAGCLELLAVAVSTRA